MQFCNGSWICCLLICILWLLLFVFNARLDEKVINYVHQQWLPLLYYAWLQANHKIIRACTVFKVSVSSCPSRSFQQLAGCFTKRMLSKDKRWTWLELSQEDIKIMELQQQLISIIGCCFFWTEHPKNIEISGDFSGVLSWLLIFIVCMSVHYCSRQHYLWFSSTETGLQWR